MSESNSTLKALPSNRLGQQAAKRLSTVIIYLALAIFTLILFMPFIWMVSLSLKTLPQVGQYPPNLIPNPVAWENYYQALVVQQPFLLYLRNTGIIAVLVIIGEILSSTFIAYGFAKLRFPGRDLLFTILLATLMIPFVVKLVPLFVQFRKLDWINTFLPLVVPSFFGTPFSIFLMRQFFMTIPNELNEAARIDGANELRIWWQIYLPLSKPAVAVVAIFAFQNVWNDFLGPLVYLQRQEVKTVTLGLYSLIGMFIEYNTVMAGAVAIIIPMVIVFLLFQRFFIKGIAVTGIKG
jgi:multiple sugar transport system permease protein